MSNLKEKSWVKFLLKWVPEALRFIGELGIIFMILIVIADVTMRTLFNYPIIGTLEVVTYWFMVAISFVGMWLAQKRREHISVTMLTDKFSAQGKFLHRMFSNFLTLAFLIALAWYGWFNALDNMARGEFTGATHVVIWPMRFLVPITMAAFIITIILQTIDEIRNAGVDVEDEEEDEYSIGSQL